MDMGCELLDNLLGDGATLLDDISAGGKTIGRVANLHALNAVYLNGAVGIIIIHDDILNAEFLDKEEILPMVCYLVLLNTLGRYI